MNRLITDDWEVTQKPIEFKPDFREPIEIEVNNLAPFWGDSAIPGSSYKKMRKYVRYINQQARKGYPQQAFHEYDEEHRMFGHYSNARIIKDKVWVTFTPKKTGDFWISYTKSGSHYYAEQ